MGRKKKSPYSDYASACIIVTLLKIILRSSKTLSSYLETAFLRLEEGSGITSLSSQKVNFTFTRLKFRLVISLIFWGPE
jgi:hypothetical protein